MHEGTGTDKEPAGIPSGTHPPAIHILVVQTELHNGTKKGPPTPRRSFLFYWRPLGDSNPRRRRERAVSWAGLDEGDMVSRVGVEPTTT